MTPLMLARTGWCAGLALGLGCMLFASPGCSNQAAADRVPPPPVVGVVKAQQKTVPIIAETIGTTTALQEVSVRARVRGFLKEILFQEGANVKKGQLLFVIDEEPFKAKLDEAKARLDEAEAALKKANDSKAREVATAQRSLDQSELALAEVEERREQALMKRNASTLEDVQRRQAQRKKNAAQVEADEANLAQAKADHDTNILAAQAQVAAAKASLADAEINLSYCRMSSPIDGRIGVAEVKAGNLVGPLSSGGGSDYTELAVVRQLEPIGVDLQVASRYLDRIVKLINQGLPIEIFRPGLEGEEARRFSGKATVIDNTINATTSTFLLQGEVANKEETILPGEYVRVVAKVGELPDAIIVPEQSVVESQAGPTVYVVDAQGKVAIVPVKASFTYEGQRVIESGLQADQDVIVDGIQLVRSGMTVKTTAVSPEALRAAEAAKPKDMPSAGDGATKDAPKPEPGPAKGF